MDCRVSARLAAMTAKNADPYVPTHEPAELLSIVINRSGLLLLPAGTWAVLKERYVGMVSHQSPETQTDLNTEKPIDRVLAVINAKPYSKGYLAHCPSHRDNEESL